MISLKEFVEESNRIEDIRREPTPMEIFAHEHFLSLPKIKVLDLEEFVQIVADAKLRDEPGMNVHVGRHLPPPGGPLMRDRLQTLLEADLPAYQTHLAYENLHPFMDGNGRSGRVLWAKQTVEPFALPFLHRFYYQTLEARRDNDA